MFLIESLFKPETNEEIYERVVRSDQDPNQFHNWFSKIQFFPEFSPEVKIPKSTSVNLPANLYFAINCDVTDQVDPILKERFNQLLDNARISAGLEFPVFIKSGLFSGKFDFKNCVVNSSEEFYQKYYGINYLAMMFGVDPTREVVIREFIDIPHEWTIYDDMPLHTELRAFVDFDKSSVMGIVDYWNVTIVENLPKEQRSDFLWYKEGQSGEFGKAEAKLLPIIQKWLEENDLKFEGRWSIDFMFDPRDESFYLIDMAQAERSWGFDLIR